MRIMGIDFGFSRTGVSVCDKSEFLASPLTVIHEKDFGILVAKLLQIIEEEKIEHIVIGYPKKENNTVGKSGEQCEILAETLREKSKLAVRLWDERYSTVTAHQVLNVTNTRGKKRKAVVDAVAATMILENYLAFRKNQVHS